MKFNSLSATVRKVNELPRRKQRGINHRAKPVGCSSGLRTKGGKSSPRVLKY